MSPKPTVRMIPSVWLRGPNDQPTNMVLSLTPLSLADITRDAAAGPALVEYLELRGIKTPATLALLSKDEEGLDRTLIQPLLQGWQREDGTTISISETDKPIAKATIIHMWMMAKQSWEQAQLAAKPKPPPSAAAPTGSTGAAQEDKVPKALAPGRWSSLIQEYQGQQIGGQDRVFPVQELLGAEHIITRVLHEHEVSKTYTPVLLGELVSTRTFQANGEPNPLAKRDRSVTKLTLTGEQLVAAQEEPWQPRSVLAILDGLSSIRWCFILCKMGPEQSVHAFFDWLVKLVRSRPQKTDQLAQYWMSVSWRLALEMRGGKTFHETTTMLMKDYDSFTECMNREPSQIIKKTSPTTTAKTEAKSAGKGNTKSGKSSRPTPYTRPTGRWQWEPNDKSEKASGSWQGNPKQEERQTWKKDAWSSDWKYSSK